MAPKELSSIECIFQIQLSVFEILYGHPSLSSDFLLDSKIQSPSKYGINLGQVQQALQEHGNC
jgi:hypothetical protein